MSKFNKIVSKQRQERKQQTESEETVEMISSDTNELSPVQRRAAAGTQHGLTLKRINIDLIDPSPYQPRLMFASNQDELQELADNIRQNGQINPILVRPKNGRYELIGGERRLNAIRDILKLKDIDCIIKDISDEKAAITALVDNINRADLTDYEIAHALKKSCEIFGYPVDKSDFITEKFNISRNKYYRLISLFDLPNFISDDLAKLPDLLSGSGASLLKTALNKTAELIGLQTALSVLEQHWIDYVEEFEQTEKRHTQFIKNFEQQAFTIFQNEDIELVNIVADDLSQNLEKNVKDPKKDEQKSTKLMDQQMSLLNKKGKKFGSLKCIDSVKGNKVVSIRFNIKDISEEKLAKLKDFLQDFE